MPQSLSQILLHIIFSTKNRVPLIEQRIENELHSYLASIFNNHDCYAHQVGGIENHVHIACNFNRTITVSKLIEEVKTSSSKWIKTKGDNYHQFSWQNGYGVFSFSMSQLQLVKEYIMQQREHHRLKTFEKEYRDFLLKYQIKYDEKYVWD